MSAYERFAEVYDALMADVDYDKWAEYLLSMMPDGELSIVDCACGTGQISLRMAKRGHRLTGVDRSEDMLQIAAERMRAAGVRVSLVRQDMSRLELHKPADVILCVCDGVNYLTSLSAVERFFDRAFACLKPGGLLMFDVSSRYKLERVLGNRSFGEDDSERAYVWLNAYDDKSKLVRMSLSFFIRRGNLYERFTEEHTQRAHSQTELSLALKRAGFEMNGIYEAFSDRPPRPCSERIQFVAVKPNAKK